ncbi:hypothetical protein [Frankia sp. CiP3]|uniref:hypothetical protein n=1 Tax=Frankia sp. CiP3 TaxID=2880971 RepID=UPI001EF63251|nr:hypothetical protein [Frankia sp. CiP3]
MALRDSLLRLTIADLYRPLWSRHILRELQSTIVRGDRLRSMADTPRTATPRFERPYTVTGDLDLLRGPSSGIVRLPTHLDWSGSAEYDLDAPGRIVDLYRAVLIEAASPQDLYTYLDGAMLRRLWALLWLPVPLRAAWEQRFPVLADISRATAA